MSKENETSIIKAGLQSQLTSGAHILGRFQVVHRSPDEQSSFLCKRITAPRVGELVVLRIFEKARVSEDLDTAATRFQHEIVAAFGVKHENVTQILETVRIGDVFGYIVEYYDGETLTSVLEASRVLEVPRVIHLLKQICAGTKAIHAAGIVHRGLKPNNIIINRSAAVKIRDFGLAKIEDQKRITKAGALVGTLAFMSPEYVLDGKCDYRLDLYSIGVMAYEMLCGVIPYESDDFAKMFTARVTKPIPRPEILCPQCPEALGDFVIKALQPDPLKRFQTAAEMVAAIEAIPVESTETLEFPMPESALNRSRVTHAFGPNPLGLPPAPSTKRPIQKSNNFSGAFMEGLRKTFGTKKEPGK